MEEKRANRRMWRTTSGYGQRVGSEGCSSSLKRTFGDRARSKKPCNAGVKSAESRSTTA